MTARPSYETPRAVAFVAAYVALVVLVVHARDEVLFWTAVAAHPLFGFALARWWGVLAAPLALAVAYSLPSTSVEVPAWFFVVYLSPFAGALIAAGFGLRVAYDRRTWRT